MFAVVNLAKRWQTFSRNSPKSHNHLSWLRRRQNLIIPVLIFRQENKSLVSPKCLLTSANYYFFTNGLRPEHQQVKYAEMIHCVGDVFLYFIMDSLSWSNDYPFTGCWTASTNLRVWFNSSLIFCNTKKKTSCVER